MRRDTAGNYRILTLVGDEMVSISGLTLANGRAVDGGGIYVDGASLTLADSTLTGNLAVGINGGYPGGTGGTGRGGGLYVARGTVNLRDSTLSANQAIGGGGGSGSYGGGDGGAGLGGGIYVGSGTVDISGSTLSENAASGGQGGYGGTYPTPFSGSPVGGPGGGGGSAGGAGLYMTGGVLAVHRSTLANNRVTGGDGGHGGIAPYLPRSGPGGHGGSGLGSGICVIGAANMTVDHTTLAGNRATGGAGGGSASKGGDGGIGIGGAISIDGIVTATIGQDTITGNQAIGGPGAAGSALPPGSGGNGSGGGAYITGGATVEVQHSTISGNQAVGGQAGDYGSRFAGTGTGGGIANFSRGRKHDTILAGNTVDGPGSNAGPDLAGALNSQGYNLIGNSQGGSGFDPTDLLDIDPLLGPLQDNGGPTQTMALLPGSPAIDAGDNTDAPDWDQRGEGYPRIVNDVIDIGAFEYQGDDSGSRIARAGGRSERTLAPVLASLPLAVNHPTTASPALASNPTANLRTTDRLAPPTGAPSGPKAQSLDQWFTSFRERKPADGVAWWDDFQEAGLVWSFPASSRRESEPFG